ncbi:hypothetical protein DMA11_20810 [Marinilabiliaceae bacterium JC017]|nr:hypothetical protein DMA11_20810 [Marinilabiliaceae bacterium JC017]
MIFNILLCFCIQVGRANPFPAITFTVLGEQRVLVVLWFNDEARIANPRQLGDITKVKLLASSTGRSLFNYFYCTRRAEGIGYFMV